MSEKTYKSIKKKYYDIISVAGRTKQTVHLVAEHDKTTMLEQIIKKNPKQQAVIITKSKRRADELSTYLIAQNIKAKAIHGNHRTAEQETTATAFNRSEINVLITTDMILESLNLTTVSLLISYDLPSQVENYFIRLGHLKELGESIALISPQEQGQLSIIELLMKLEIPQEEVAEFLPTPPPRVNKALLVKKDKNKKPRHRKQLAKKGNKAQGE